MNKKKQRKKRKRKERVRASRNLLVKNVQREIVGDDADYFEQAGIDDVGDK